MRNAVASGRPQQRGPLSANPYRETNYQDLRCMARKRKVATLPAAAQEGLPTECPHWRSSAARPTGNIGRYLAVGPLAGEGRKTTHLVTYPVTSSMAQCHPKLR